MTFSKGATLKSCIVCLMILLFAANTLLAQTYSQSGGTATLSDKTYSTSTANQSAVTVSNSGVLTLTNSTIKTTGNTSSQDSSSFYGLNAAVLSKSAGTIYLTGCSITTTGEGANGVFSTGTGSSIVLSKDTIYCSGSGGHGVDATIAGKLTLTDVVITTTNSHGAAIATDRGGGTIVATGGTVLTSGQDSPGIYSTGTITVADATITATGSEAAVIEGANSITLTNTNMTAAKGTRDRALMIYQSMSGDASGNKGVYTMTGGTFTWPSTTGPMFYATNTTAIITITGVSIVNSSPTLIKAAEDQWGTSGKNGGTIVFTADNETMTGNLICDNISSIAITLQNNSTLTGTIDSASLSLDATSKWIVTGTSYITSLTDPGGISGTTITNITGNGYLVYYNSGSTANSALGGKTYTLVNGGKLLPYGTSATGDQNIGLIYNWKLDQNFPNPFNPSTIISYQVQSGSNVSLKVYDVIGREVAVLVNEWKPAGSYQVSFNAANLSSGTYLYRLQAGSTMITRKMILLR